MRIFLILVSCAVFISSCTTQKQLTAENYLQNLRDTAKINLSFKETVIQKHDLLHIQIYSSSTNPLIDEPYNLRTTDAKQGANVAGFLVDANGNIDYPRLGTIKAEGLTKYQLAALIKNKLAGQLENPTVIIRFLNYRVTVLGEVNNPGVVNVPNERLTILEALGMAGDITEYGKRSNVKIIRENGGQQNLGTIDLTSSELFKSPYYQLEQNDIVMVEQGPRRLKETADQKNLQKISIATSIVSTIVLILTLFR